MGEKLFVEGYSRKGRDLELEENNLVDTEDIMSSDEDLEDEEVLEEENDSETMKEVEAQKEISPLEIARFNNYMDAIYRRMNAALRAKLMDPMTINLGQTQKKKESPEKKRSTRSAEELDVVTEDDKNMKEEEEEEDETDSVDRMGLADPKKNKKQDKKLKKDKAKKKKDKIKGKNKGRNKKNKDKKGKKSDEKKNKKKKNTKQTTEQKRKSRESRGNKDSRRKHGEHNNKKNSNKNKKPSSSRAREDKIAEREAKTMGSLAGIATLRRSGDVLITNEENHKIVSSQFSVGPLQLEVSKSYGRGQARTLKTAKAITEVMYGNMVLKVKPDGSAHVKKVVFKSPDSVEVRGSIAEKKQRSDTYLKNSVKKMRPLAALKILKTARFILKTPSTVRKN